MTREEAQQILEAWLTTQSKGTDKQLGYIEGLFDEKDEKAFHMAIEALKGQEWIPVSERLPKEEAVLACNKNKIMMVGHICACHNGEYQAYTYDDEMDWVVAWMPLPKPYKAEGEETNEYVE